MSTYSIMQSAPGPEKVIDDVRYLHFGGTSDLGLANHPEVSRRGARRCGYTTFTATPSRAAQGVLAHEQIA